MHWLTFVMIIFRSSSIATYCVIICYLNRQSKCMSLTLALWSFLTSTLNQNGIKLQTPLDTWPQIGLYNESNGEVWCLATDLNIYLPQKNPWLNEVDVYWEKKILLDLLTIAMLEMRFLFFYCKLCNFWWYSINRYNRFNTKDS
jgi:hypothetical protein